MTYSMHMVQQVILAQLVPLPLVVTLGYRLRRLRAPLAWAIGVGTMIATSLPPAYLLVQRSAVSDWTMRAVLIVAGVVFWMPLFGGVARRRVAPGAALLYVITACFATTLAGIYIAFSAVSSDQQVAGLIMWVPCCLIYLSAALAIVVRTMSGAATTQADPSLRSG